MQNTLGTLKFRYILFIVSVIITIAATQLFVQYDLNLQDSDARLINQAGRQRMLSQRISKIILFMYYNEERNETSSIYSIDSLKKMSRQWRDMHYYLIELNRNNQQSKKIDSLLSINTPRVEQIMAVSNSVVAQRSKQSLKSAIDVLGKTELPFLLTMETTVATYQNEAEERLRSVKYLEITLAVISVVILLGQFIFIFSPTLKQLQEQNDSLQEANANLVSSEEEIRTNMEQILSLKDDLELRQMMYQRLVDEASDLIYELSDEGKFTFVNPVLERTTGYSKSELIGKQFSELIYPDDREQIVKFYINQLKALNEVSYQQFRIITKEGAAVWVGQNVRMFFNRDRVIKVSVVARNIDKLKEVEKILTQERILLRTIIDNIPINIYAKNRKSEKILANKAEYEFTGVKSEQDLLGKSDLELYPSNSADISIQEDQFVMQGNSILSRETFNIKKDGTETWFLISKIPLRNEAGEIVGLVGSSLDITEIKNAERDLIEAREKAEDAAVAKSQFLSMMSHEIRTPLNGVVGIANILMDDEPRADQLENLKLLKFSCDHLLSIINDILDFNKAESGKISLESIPFNISEVIRHYVKLFQEQADKKQIELKVNIDTDLPNYVLGDPVRLGQVINNLVGNAIKFTNHGHVKISVTKIHSENASHTIRFSIKDTGIGIPEEKIQTIFQQFNQASADTTRKFGGTGLGLSITKKILELMHSQVMVKSELGQGSEFSFDVTMIETSGVSEESSDQKINLKGAGKRILLVEDNEVNQKVAGKFLVKWEFNVSYANNGIESLEKIQSKDFDLVLMDINMPEMDGYEAAKRIRRMGDQYFKQVPIIALTADISPEIRAKVLESGMNEILTKPFRPHDLQTVIANHLKIEVRQEKNPSSEFPKLKTYTDGDPDFEKELIKTFIVNLNELNSKLMSIAGQSNPIQVFSSIEHKCKTTLTILDDADLNKELSKVRQAIQTSADLRNAAIDFESFSRANNNLIKRLKQRIA